MTEEIRKNAEALIEALEEKKFTYQVPHATISEGNPLVINAADIPAAQALKASLRPSREEIADRLEKTFMAYSPKDQENADKFVETINYAIEELRK